MAVKKRSYDVNKMIVHYYRKMYRTKWDEASRASTGEIIAWFDEVQHMPPGAARDGYVLGMMVNT